LGLPTTIKVDVHKALQSLEMGFLPIASFEGRTVATYLNPAEPELRVDFLTPLNRAGEKPFNLPNLNVALQPLKFMEFALEHPTQAAMFHEEGAVIVNVPMPVRYALHKLLVWGEREEAFRTKAGKDLVQSAALISYLKDHRPTEIHEAWIDLLGRGKGWRKRAEEGIGALDKAAPELGVRELLYNAK
jgi:hypothetical protein